MNVSKINAVSPFLSLPAELRNEIYLYLIHAPTEPAPLNPSCPGARIWSNEIAHPQSYCSWRYPSLVWVNRQIRNEYFTLVDDCSKRRETCAELDVMSNGYIFYPTWTHLPPNLPGEAPFDLQVELRVFSTAAYRSNDGWPRQPGSGFRSLLLLLQQLIHHGPSFGQHLELLRGRWLFTINTLHINLTFHDPYTPDTRPETSHAIFRMLKALATHGVAGGLIKQIHAHTQYECKGARKVYDSTWDVATTYDAARAAEWKQMGFLTRHQRTLKDDYRGGAVEGDYV